MRIFAYCEPCVYLKKWVAVACGEPVYLTKNGYGAMVVLSLEAYSRLTDGFEAALEAESFEPYRSLKERRYPYYRIYVKNFVVDDKWIDIINNTPDRKTGVFWV